MKNIPTYSRGQAGGNFDVKCYGYNGSSVMSNFGLRIAITRNNGSISQYTISFVQNVVQLSPIKIYATSVNELLLNDVVKMLYNAGVATFTLKIDALASGKAYSLSLSIGITYGNYIGFTTALTDDYNPPCMMYKMPNYNVIALTKISYIATQPNVTKDGNQLIISGGARFIRWVGSGSINPTRIVEVPKCTNWALLMYDVQILQGTRQEVWLIESVTNEVEQVELDAISTNYRSQSRMTIKAKLYIDNLDDYSVAYYSEIMTAKKINIQSAFINLSQNNLTDCRILTKKITTDVGKKQSKKITIEVELYADSN